MVKLVILVIICGIIIVYLRSVNSSLSSLATVASGIMILSVAFGYVYKTYDVLSQIIEMSGVDTELYIIIFKVTSIGYLVEFGAGTVEDMGLKSLADKLVFAGKVIIILVSMPIVYALINLIGGLLK